MSEITPAPLPPHVGARIRWQWHTGTNFGRVLSVDEDSGRLIAQIEDSTAQAVLDIDKVALLSAPGGAA